jgi:hypothetical protein
MAELSFEVFDGAAARNEVLACEECTRVGCDAECAIAVRNSGENVTKVARTEKPHVAFRTFDRFASQ